MPSQSRDGPRLDLEVMISTMSPERSLVCSGTMRPLTFAPTRVTADVGVHREGEVDRRRAGGQALDVALGREHEDLVLEEVDAQRVDELARVAGL